MRVIEQEDNLVAINKIGHLTKKLETKFKKVLAEDRNLSRQLVSFQANKQRPVYRWFKYKEGFSADLIDYLRHKFSGPIGDILDPFAGAGTTLFASQKHGVDSHGIELLPIGSEVIRTRKIVENGIERTTLERVEIWAKNNPWNAAKNRKEFIELKITRGAYPEETKKSIEQYLYCMEQESPQAQQILLFALLCILESISYTRKDGQYLRWDFRSGRISGAKQFNKGEIKSFENAITDKLNEILSDLKNEEPQINMFKPKRSKNGNIFLYESSCLEQLPKLKDEHFGSIITSPPYCNRYDYTRTYALELAMLGIDEDNLRSLRQKMVSCTVENKEKDLLAIKSNWDIPLSIAKNQKLLQEILAYLGDLKESGQLNNDGILRMVKGYFYEMCCVIYECHRVLKKNGFFIMVNDNVKYAGVGIPVDAILSDFASSLGFEVKNILVLPQGKGNSSQQMGQHGREVLRKCVYVWQKG